MTETSVNLTSTLNDLVGLEWKDAAADQKSESSSGDDIAFFSAVQRSPPSSAPVPEESSTPPVTMHSPVCWPASEPEQNLVKKKEKELSPQYHLQAAIEFQKKSVMREQIEQ